MKKNISILGSTGSIGKSTLSVVRNFKSAFKVKCLSANTNIELLEKQAHEFNPEFIAVYDQKKAKELQSKLPKIKVIAGMEGLIEIASLEDVDFVMAGISGSIGIAPVVAAIKAKKTIGIANKEVLVSAGKYVTDLAKENGVSLLPVDSEHNAIFQCLNTEDKKSIKRLIITASGGPFRQYSSEKLNQVTVEDALNHPTYSMGAKISVDSSTLMNKGLEVIEAYFLFGVPLDKIDVIVHPQSVIHSMVEFIDGSIIAQLNEPNMEVPIQYALTYPLREKAEIATFDFLKNPRLDFYKPDLNKFKCLNLAYEALREGKSMPCYMNGVNEVLVDRFLKKEIKWNDIYEKLEKLMSSHKTEDMLNLEAILEIDRKAKNDAKTI